MGLRDLEKLPELKEWPFIDGAKIPIVEIALVTTPQIPGTIPPNRQQTVAGIVGRGILADIPVVYCSSNFIRRENGLVLAVNNVGNYPLSFKEIAGYEILVTRENMGKSIGE